MSKIIGHKAVLIYPEFDTQDTFWSYAKSLKMYAPPGEFGRPKRLLPPLGLMGLYNHLKPYYEQLCLIDKNIDPRPISEFIKDADHVYIGGMMAQEQSLVKLAQQVKKAHKILIVGGTAISPQSPLMQIADHLLENEAEGVIDQLLDELGKGSAKKYYKGSFAPAENFFQPDYAAINMQNYVHMAVQISRGCPERCEFCDIPSRFGKAFRVTPWQKTEQSFQQMKDLGWTGQVFIVDDNFIGNPRKALDVLKSLYKIGEKIGYHHPKYTELTLRLADESPVMAELRHWFHKANFINGFYGVETPNEASLLETDKRQNLRGERSLVDKLRFISEQTGAGVMMGMIYGFDHDSDDSVQEFIDFVNASHAPIVMAGLLNALPCTPLIARMQKEGRMIQASSGNNSDGIINFIPYNFSVRQAEQNYLRILQGIYHPQAYFDRVMRHLELIDPDLQSNFRASNGAVAYLVKILSKKHALTYWRYLPVALAIANRRCGLNTSGYLAIVAEYFSLCGQYTHFSSQVNAQEKNIAQRDYTDSQKVTWSELKSEVSTVTDAENIES
ncbi:B12-binding domain-containing radical SAM protein [Methyloprofundus sp.]|uniref:B12-binding domain-containing radical SAM protein n=1 Tax=Methyloprofundus sp. TaxID=2020875 RepID=UPI003D11CFAA